MTLAQDKMTPWRRNTLRKQREEANKKKPAKNKTQAAMKGKCGAKKKDGTLCQQMAGFRTDHPGTGRCRWHGGLAPNHQLRAYKEEAIFMGAPKEINAVDALVWCIKVMGGEVEWLSEKMAELQKSEWYEYNDKGERMLHTLARARSEAVQKLAKMSADAIKLGIEERRVRLAEQYGNSIAKLLKSVLDELMPHITPEGIKLIPVIIRKNLMLLEQGAFSQSLESRAELERAS
jgi:hypothetical protein